MIPFVALAFACFLNAWSSVCAASRGNVLNTEDCVSAINLARTALLDDSVPAVVAASTRGSYVLSLLGVGGNVYETLDDTADCTVYQNANPAGLGGLFLKTGEVKQPDAKTIARLIQKELNDALSVIKNDYQEKWGQRNSEIYSHPAAQNLAFLMQSTVKEVTCGAPSNCKTGQSVVLCLFDADPAQGKPPFSKALLTALQARKAANVDISKLFEQEMLKDGTKTPNPSGTRAVPCTLAVFLSIFALLLAY